jgi:hypothetical protein
MQNYTSLTSVPSWHVIGRNLLFYHLIRFHIASATTEVLPHRDMSVSSPRWQQSRVSQLFPQHKIWHLVRERHNTVSVISFPDVTTTTVCSYIEKIRHVSLFSDRLSHY